MSTHVAIPQPTPQDFARDFRDLSANLENQIKALTSGNPVVKQRQLGRESAKLMRNASELRDQMDAQGWVQATIINFNPFPIKVNSVLHEEILPACGPTDDYSYVVLRDWGLDRRDNGEGVFTCHAWVPMQLAKDYERECQLNEWGGVFFYAGNFLPDDPNIPPDRKAVIDAEMDKASKACRAWCRKMVRIASTEYDRPNGDRRIINDLHRAAYAWLSARGFMKENEKPKWADLSTEEAIPRVMCPGCRKQVEVGIVNCPNCPYIFDPERAFMLTIIGPEHNALRRLPQETLNSLGLENVKSISHLISEGGAVTRPVASNPVGDDYALTGKLPRTGEVEDEDLIPQDPDDVDDADVLQNASPAASTDSAQTTAQAAGTKAEKDAKKAEKAAKTANNKAEKEAKPKSQEQKKAEEAL